jgi:hypothetical protein
MTALERGRLRSAESRRAAAEEGMAFARAFAAQRRPVAMTCAYPIRDARTCAEWA